jgi:cytochrome c oxidase subunit 2
MLMAVVLIVIVVGSVVFHLVSPWWSTPIASNWGSIDTTIDITFWITGVVYVAVLLFMAYCLYRFRYNPDRRSEYQPENHKLELWLSGLTALGVVGLLTPGLIVWNDYINPPDEATEIEVVGKQWEWSFRLPGKDGVLGTTNIRFMNDDNPFGVNPNDPAGQDDVLIEGDDLHLQLDKPVKILLRAVDVLHNFYVPQFRAKMDMVPGMVTFIWLTPNRTDTFDILCAELCGIGHHVMRGLVVVETGVDYEKWLQEQTTFAQSVAALNKKSKSEVKLVSKLEDTQSQLKVTAQ